MTQMLGSNLATKYTAVKKKNRECSLYGFLIDSADGQPKLKLEKLCQQLIQGTSRGLKVEYDKRVYVFLAQDRFSQPWSLMQIQSMDASFVDVHDQAGVPLRLYQRTICMYDNLLKNSLAENEVTIKGVTKLKVNDKEVITT